MKYGARLDKGTHRSGSFFKPEAVSMRSLRRLLDASPACLPADLRCSLLEMPFQPGLPPLEQRIREGLIVDPRVWLGLLEELA